MPDKWGRNYKLDIYTPAGIRITIEPPFSIQFDVSKKILANSPNILNITLYNLGPNTRNQIYKDRYSDPQYWKIQLYSGYGNKLYEIFRGNIYEAYSYKNNTDWKTEIESWDGHFAIINGFSSFTVSADTPQENIITQIIADMPNAIAGVIGSVGLGTAARGKTICGQSSEVLNVETDGNYFFDSETVNVLTDDEVISGNIISLDSRDLLGTPRRRETFLDVPVLFEPQLSLGHIYKISSLEPRFNGQYKVMGFSHAVTISGAECGTAQTNMELYYGAAGLQEVG